MREAIIQLAATRAERTRQTTARNGNAVFALDADWRCGSAPGPTEEDIGHDHSRLSASRTLWRAISPAQPFAGTTSHRTDATIEPLLRCGLRWHFSKRGKVLGRCNDSGYPKQLHAAHIQGHDPLRFATKSRYTRQPQ